MGSASAARLSRLAHAHRWTRRAACLQFTILAWLLVEVLAVGIHRADWRLLAVGSLLGGVTSIWVGAVLASKGVVLLGLLALVPGVGLLPHLLVDRTGSRRMEQAGARVGWLGITDRELDLALERLAD